MNGILGMIEIVLDSSIKVDQRKHLETARQCANSLLALLNGVNDCVRAHELKPRRQGIELHEEIERSLPVSPLEAKPPGNVLLVEDNLVNQKVVAAILRKRGLNVVLACNGLEALEKLEIEAFGLVLMDVQMPVLDGLETTRIIRKDVRWARMPIVAMTASAMNGDRGRCLDAGMNGYVSKPVNSSHLLATVGQYISPVEAEAGTKDVEPAPVARIESAAAEDLVSLFIQLAPDRLREMHNAASRADRVRLSDEARQMREAAGQIAATAVSNCARRIDEASERGDLAKAKHSLLLLEAEIMRISYRAKALPEPVTRPPGCAIVKS